VLPAGQNDIWAPVLHRPSNCLETRSAFTQGRTNLWNLNDLERLRSVERLDLRLI